MATRFDGAGAPARRVERAANGTGGIAAVSTARPGRGESLPAVGVATFPNSSPELWTGAVSLLAAGHPLSAEAGARILREGGNAVDAAVVAAPRLCSRSKVR